MVRRRARGLGLGDGSRQNIDERRCDDENGDASVEHGSRIRDYHERRSGCNRCSWIWAWARKFESGPTPTLPNRSRPRHVELRYLWLQDMTKTGRVKMRRFPGELNLPDRLTNGKRWREIDELVRGGAPSGRSDTASKR